jgi:ClpP class serine protease
MTSQKTPAEAREGRWRYLLIRALSQIGEESGIDITTGQLAVLVATLDAMAEEENLRILWVAEFAEALERCVSESDAAYRQSPDDFTQKVFWQDKRAQFTKLLDQLQETESVA